MQQLCTHDLVRLQENARIDWVAPSAAAPAQALLAATPWAVVRRAAAPHGMVSIGVRGGIRSQRYAGFARLHSVLQALSPQDLLANTPRRNLPALAAFLDLRARWADLAWGPTGSVAFELATGIPACTPASDLDVAIRCDQPLTLRDAQRIWADAESTACRVDVQVETPHGAILLQEWLQAQGTGSSARCLLRTATGPHLVRDPWSKLAAEGVPHRIGTTAAPPRWCADE